MAIKFIKKRDGSTIDFDRSRIEKAIARAYEASKVRIDIVSLMELVDGIVATLESTHEDRIPEVEDIQNVVEKEIAEKGDFEVAKAYVLYREERNKDRKRDIFKKKIYLKPYEYPELYDYVDAVRHSYWIHTEFNFVGDIQDFRVNVSEEERNVIRNTMLAIAQIEVAVKTFWGDVYKKMPKPEIGAVGATFAESEVRHTDAYSHLLEILGLNDAFKSIDEVPALIKRVHYLEKALATAKSEDNREYSQSILLFSLFIEHVSLFSQFLIMMSFNKYKNLFKGISNAVEATSKEEQIHGLFGIDLINIVKEEHPEWFNDEFEEAVIKLCEEAFESESQVVGWIFEKGEPEFITKDVVLEFIKQRFNNSLHSIGIRKIFDLDEALLKKSDWFYDEVIATKHGDFFIKRSINYNKKNKSITSDDLF
ncbi:MAG: ribonucleotide-diphosphate reductase subunit beta [Candidatus Paceibacterota bacterium]